MAQALKHDDIKSSWSQSSQENNSLVANLSARDLSITWGSDPRYWKWVKIKEDICGDLIEVAELIKVWWLQIDGKYDQRKLKEGLKYEVKFVVELKNNFVMEDPVNLKLSLPDGTTQVQKENLMEKPRNQWIGLKVGEFTVPPINCGCADINFTMMNTNGNLKKGLVVIGALISAKI